MKARGRAHVGALSRPIEGREEAVAGHRHLSPSEPSELGAHQVVMLIEHVAPGAVAQLGGELRGADDVGEQLRFPVRSSTSVGIVIDRRTLSTSASSVRR
jgi:hypothetical protein